MNDALEQNSSTRYILKEDPQPRYLRIILEGAWDNALIGEIADGILGLCVKHQTRKILCDMREFSGNPSVMARFHMATTFTMKYIRGRLSHRLPPCRFAVVGHHPLVDPNRFEETMAVNNGLPVKTFTDLEKAVAWLTAD